MVELICVKTYDSRLAAERDHGYLEDSGVPAMVATDAIGGLLPCPFSPVGYDSVKLLVWEEDASRAHELLA